MVLVSAAPASAAFSCPSNETPTADDKRTVAQLTESGHGADISAAVGPAVQKMRAENVKSGVIVDRLVAAQCARLTADAALSDKARADDVQRFAYNVASLVYAAPGRTEEDVLVDVPVPTTVFRQVRTAAETAKISVDAWMNQAIRGALTAR